MKLDNIPDSLYVTIVVLALLVVYVLAPTPAVLTLIEIGIGGLLGLAKNRQTAMANPLPVKEVAP